MYPRRKNWNEDTSEDEDFYSRDFRERLVEEGVLNYEEEGFMEGYEWDLEENFEEEHLDEMEEQF